MNPKYEESLRLSKEWLDSHTKEELEEILKDCPENGPTVEEYFRAIRPRGLDMIFRSSETPWGLTKKYTMESKQLESAINGDMTREEIEDFAQHVFKLTLTNSYLTRMGDCSPNLWEAKMFNTRFEAELFYKEQGDNVKNFEIVPVFTDKD